MRTSQPPPRDSSGLLGSFTALVAVALAVSIVAAACAGRPSGSASSAVGSMALAQVAASAAENVPSALEDPTAPGLPKPLVDPALIQPGGPPPDGIPPVDHPRFQQASQVDWLRPREPVLAATVNGEDRAYPVQILIWHEIVNDTVGGVPVAITYCPLCNSAIAYDRRVAGRVLDFGTSGKLYDSDLVAYDRQTRSLWVQFLGQAVAGVLTGTRLQAYPMATVSWADWRRDHPQGWVLARDTGFARPYGSNPYPGYDRADSSPFLFSGSADPRLAPMTRVVGLEQGGDALAIALDDLRRRRVEEVTLAGQRVVVWSEPGTVSALAGPTVATGPDIGATGAFVPAFDGRALHFDGVSGGFVDRETHTTWDVLGRGLSGPLSGRSLTPVGHVDTFWFAWAAFKPATRLLAG